MTHIVYGVDNKYLPPVLVSAYSALKTVSGTAKVTILTTDPPIEDTSDLDKLSACFPSADIHIQPFDSTVLHEYEQTRTTGWPAASMTPLFIPWLIPDRCLFLDADTVVLHDISELYRTDMGGKPLGACQSPSTVFTVRKHMSFGLHSIVTPGRTQRRRRELFEWKDRIGFTIEELQTKYFSSGILLYDTETIRRTDPARHLADIKATRKHWGSMPDMDRMNEFFKDRVHFLDLKWNVYRDFLRFNRRYSPPDLWSDVMAAAANPGLLHYPAMFRRKPWDRPWFKTRQRHTIYKAICREIESRAGIEIFRLFAERLQ